MRIRTMIIQLKNLHFKTKFNAYTSQSIISPLLRLYKDSLEKKNQVVLQIILHFKF